MRNLILESPKRLQRVRSLMEQYNDRPMDLAEASLVALPEERTVKVLRMWTHHE